MSHNTDSPIPDVAKTLAEKAAQYLQELHRLSTNRYATATERYADYLSTGSRLLGMEIGIISQITSNIYTILSVIPNERGMHPGQTFSLENTYCAWVVDKAAPMAVECVGMIPGGATHPVYLNAKLEAYIAAPIWVEGEIYGTLNFTHAEVRPIAFTREDIQLVELLAVGLAMAIELDLVDQRRELATEKMLENVHLFENAFNHAAIGIALVAPSGVWLRVNAALCNMLGYTEDELLAIDFQLITHPDDLQADLTHVREMLHGERDTYSMEKRYFHQQGQIIWALLNVSLVMASDGYPRYFVSQIHDITHQKLALEELVLKRSQLELANRKLQQLATKDSLTHALNRRAFDERLDEEIHRFLRTQLPLSLLLLDIDYFKQYNDSYGHLAGDEALRQVVNVLSKASRAEDILARYGGEEFAIILPNTPANTCTMIAERLRIAVESIQGLARPLTISIGATTLVPGTSAPTPNQIIHATDEALYLAKAAGRNCVCIKNCE